MKGTDLMSIPKSRTRNNLIVMLALLAACRAEEAATVMDPEAVLTTFFQDLHEGRFQAASVSFQPETDFLAAMNPDLPPDETAALLERGCTTNGFMCLMPGDVIKVEEEPAGMFTYTMEFRMDDGTRFEQGPCCGADPDGPVTTAFAVRVDCSSGACYVLDMPPYVP